MTQTRHIKIHIFRKVPNLEMIEIRPKVILIVMKLCQIMYMVDYSENEPYNMIDYVENEPRCIHRIKMG